MPLEVLVPSRRRRASEARRRLGAQAARAAIAAAAAIVTAAVAPSSAAVAGGTVRGRITFAGTEPGNRVIRMGMDPMCAAVNKGKQVVNEIYTVGDKNALGNVFVKVEGTFPATPVPPQPVEIDQKACIYIPRMIGARVGQTLLVKNSDNW